MYDFPSVHPSPPAFYIYTLYTYIYICTCTYTYTYTYIHKYCLHHIVRPSFCPSFTFFLLLHTHTHTHTCIYIYIYIYMLSSCYRGRRCGSSEQIGGSEPRILHHQETTGNLTIGAVGRYLWRSHCRGRHRRCRHWRRHQCRC